MVFSVADLVNSGKRSFSFEFFPPKTDRGEHNLWSAITDLEAFAPTFVSVTYGAGGSTRDRTVRVTERIAHETSLLPVGHLTCVNASIAEIESVIEQYRAAGVNHFLALRGDPPEGPGTPYVVHPHGLEHADQLVELIESTGDFVVGVAAFPEGHPESASLDEDVAVLLSKQNKGADFAITQFFFRTEDYWDLVERAEMAGVTMPIIPGIMPVTNVAQIERFAVLSGAAFPADLADKFHALHDPASVVDLGVEVASEMSEQLLAAGAPGLHFYTLNRSTSTKRVFDNLQLHG